VRKEEPVAVSVSTKGRTDVQEYFQRSGIREHTNLNHTPLLVFQVDGDTVTVEILERADKLLEYSNDTRVMGQWKGNWRSDFLQFSVGQFRDHIAEHPRESWQMV
jgi:hypothetical protein